MKHIRKFLAFLFAVSLIPVFATAQSYDTQQNTKTVSPSIPQAPFTFSTACATPNAPLSCDPASFVNYAIGQLGGGTYSYQLPSTLNGATFNFEASNDCQNYVPVSLLNSGNYVSSTTTGGIYTGDGAGYSCIAIVASIAPSSAVVMTPFIGQKGSPSLSAPFPSTFSVTMPSLTALAPIPYPTDSASGWEENKIAPIRPLPSPTAVPIQTLNAQATIAFGNHAVTTEYCDVENLDGTAILSATSAVDAANAFAYPINGTYISSTPYTNGSALQQNGTYAFDVRGMSFLNIFVSTIGAVSQNATIQCSESYYGTIPTSIDNNARPITSLGGYTISGSAPLPVTTPPPAPTATANVISTTRLCSTGSPITISGMVTCHAATSTGNQYVNSLALRNSSNSGDPNAYGIFADNPANVACNGTNGEGPSAGAGVSCFTSVANTTSATTIVTGVTGLRTYIMGLQVTNSSATGTLFSLVEGTGGSCATGQTAIYGPLYLPAGSGFILPVGAIPYTQSLVTNGVCALTGTAVTSVQVNAQIAQF